MLRLDSLEDIIQQLEGAQEQPDSRGIRALLLSGDEEQRILGILLRACDLYKSGFPDQALQFLSTSRHRTGYTPLPIIANIAWLSHRLHQDQEAAYHCLRFAGDAVRMGFPDLALEAAGAAMILDAQGRYEITRDPEKSVAVATLYEEIAQHIPEFHVSDELYFPPRTDRLRVAMIVPNLADDIVAYTRRVVDFARYLDPERYALRVYSSENHTGRLHPHFPVGCLNGSSAERGEKTLRILARRQAPVCLTPRDLSFTRAARYLCRQLEADQTDIAIFQGGLSTPIDWLVARAARVPVKMSIHVGSSMMVPGLDATLYDNPANIERETACWAPRFGERIVMAKGVDIEDLRRHPPLSRAVWGIPPDAVVIGTLSNHLPRRMTPAYCQVIAEVMRAHPQVWFLGFGVGDIPGIRPVFRAYGVEDRLRFGGRQTQVGAALKTLDIYACEFPVGGSQSVIEAMACGVPVVAMPWSNIHAESAAAHLVGPDWALPRQDIAKYAERLREWITRPDKRQIAALAMQRHADAHYPIRTCINNCLEKAREIYTRKQEQPATKEMACLHG
ncbi:MAG: glycosyltransferase [Spartobacteria bacterium]|nr:glycosyltransferase [Spartobacteria bacterium]